MATSPMANEWLAIARTVLKSEAEAVARAADKLDGNLTCAVELILSHPGKVVVSGVGKSGHVGQKLAATLSSTGTPAVFLHAAEALHGDLGIYTPGDPTILISKSGTTKDLVTLLPTLREFESPLIGIIGNPASALAQQVDVLLDASVRAEADPYNLAPSSSSTVAAALGDALAITLMNARGFTAEDFARFHPGGQLGRNLRLRVTDVMHQEIAWVSPQATLKEVVIAMTRFPLGAACIVDENRSLLGLVTDGDVRRALITHDDIREVPVATIMTAQPITVASNARLREALNLMQNRPSQISVLPVLDSTSHICVGLIRVHDIYQS